MADPPGGTRSEGAPRVAMIVFVMSLLASVLSIAAFPQRVKLAR